MKKGDKSLIINKMINFDFYKIRNNLVEIELTIYINIAKNE